METKIWFLSLKTWKDLGYLFVFLLKGFINLFKSLPTLSQTQGRKSEQNHISSPMVFCSCSYYLVSRVRKPAIEFWIRYVLSNYRHRISFHCLSNGNDILSISQGSYENQIRWYIIQILQCKAYFCAFHAFSFKFLEKKKNFWRKVVAAEKITFALCNRLLWYSCLPFIQNLPHSELATFCSDS